MKALMKSLALTVAAGALLAATQANAGSFPVNTMNGAGNGLIDQVAVRVYVHEGHRYCFYVNGWHGAGWYRCGYAHRHGIGWGGEYGWNSWTYGPYERRHGERIHRGDRERIGVETRTNRTRSSSEIRSRSTTTGTNVDGGARARGGTTGSAPASDVQTRGGAKVQGGANVRDNGDKGVSGSAGGGATIEQKRQ